jgi:class 3 adenylate cyclase
MEMKRRPRLLVLLFTDIEGSVRLWDQDLMAMDQSLAQHDRLIRRSIATHGGRVFAVTGDGFGAVFSTADQAIAAAVGIQIKMAGMVWQPPLQVREGIHMGLVVERGRNLYGPAVNYCARITSCASGGQIVISEESLRSVKDPVDVSDLGSHQLKDLPCAMRIHQVVHPQLNRVFAPLSERAVLATPGLAT